MIVEKIKKEAIKKLLNGIKEGNSAIEPSNYAIEEIFTGIKNFDKILSRKFNFLCYNLEIITDRVAYNRLIPSSYKEKNPYRGQKYLLFSFKKDVEDAKFKISIIKDGQICTYKNIDEAVGTVVDEDKKILESNQRSYLIFDIYRNLQIINAKGFYQIIITDEEGNSKQIFEKINW